MAMRTAQLPDLTRQPARPATEGVGVRRNLGLIDPRDVPLEFDLSPQDRHVATMTRLHLEKRRREFEHQEATRAQRAAQAAAEALAREAREAGLE